MRAQLDKLRAEKDKTIEKLEGDKHKEWLDADSKTKELTKQLIAEQLRTKELEDTRVRLEDELKLKVDLETQLKTTKDNSERWRQSSDNFKGRLDASANEVKDLSKRLADSEKLAIELQHTLEETVTKLRDVKQRLEKYESDDSLYVPVKGDLVDEKLAEFINGHEERKKLRTLFFRESAGVYLFGQRRALLSWKEQSLIARVGGGYFKIDELVNEYLHVEWERLERKEAAGGTTRANRSASLTHAAASPAKFGRNSTLTFKTSPLK